MSTYRYCATNVVTGALLADTIPLHVSGFGRNLGSVGQPGELRGTLDLGALSKQSNLLAALEPRRTMLWVLQDEWPVWNGVLWDWDHQSARSNSLPIVANEVGTLFQRRQILATQSWTTDPYTVIRNLITYATSKTSGAVAQLVHTTNLFGGAAITATFPVSTGGKILDLVGQFCTQNGIEYAWDPGFASANVMTVTLRLGTAATMGRAYSLTKLQLTYPGNLVDYAWPRLGSAGRNSISAVASGSGGAPWTSGPTHGLDAADLAAGYPLLEDSVSYTGSTIGAQSQIDAVADARQQMVAKSPTVGKATLAGGQTPTVQQILLGDHAYLQATSTYHPADPTTGAPGLQQDVRIIGWKVIPPDAEAGQVESTDLYLAGVST
jgi:hypothetical protein